MPTTRFIFPKLNSVPVTEPIVDECLILNPIGTVTPRRQDDEPKRYKNPTQKLHKGILFAGFLLMLTGSAVLVFDPLGAVITRLTTFQEGSLVYKIWSNPPIGTNLMLHIFNYTNTEAFLKGEEKLHIQETGPYVYDLRSYLENATFFSNNTLKYSRSSTTKINLEKTVGNVQDDVITVPNLIFLGIASYLAESSVLVNTGFNMFSNYIDSQPFITMTVEEFLWGYSEPLLEYAKKVLPQTVPNTKMAYLSLMTDDGGVITSANMNQETEVRSNGQVIQPFTTDQVNFYSGLEYYGYVEDDNTTHDSCNTIQGRAFDVPFIPRKISSTVSSFTYTKPLCRVFKLDFTNYTSTSWGVPTMCFYIAEDSYHTSSPDNSCTCDEEEKPCLPDGLIDISPCTNKLPIALSAPHFLRGDPKLGELYDSLKADIDKHDSYTIFEPVFGFMLESHMRIQLNLVMQNTKYNVKLEPLKNTVLPLMWVDNALFDVPWYYHMALYSVIVMAPVVNIVVIAIMFLTGLTMVTIFGVRYFKMATTRTRTTRSI